MNWERHGDIWHRINGSWASHDHVRHDMYEALFGSLAGLSWREGYVQHMLEFGCLEPTSAIIRMLRFILGPDRLEPEVVDYPTVDIQATPYQDDLWDIVVADQVLEHVERPWKAADEILRITKPGGVAVVCTPYLLPIHKCPLDCWRISPDGYKVIFPASAWETITTGMWGNRQIVEQEYHSNIIRGFSGDWLPVAQAKAEIPAWDTPTDGINPIVIWNIFRKR